MIKKIFILLIIFCFKTNSQEINLNEDYLIDKIRDYSLLGYITTEYSFNQRPISSKIFSENNILNKSYSKDIFSSKNEKIKIKVLPINYNIEFNSNNPIKINNGSMIPNRGYQHIISPGIYFKLGPLELKLKPEHHFAENKDFQGFWENHRDKNWYRRYLLWNQIDMPEKFGNKNHNEVYLGQSSLKIRVKNFDFGFSNENIWWGPSRFNSIMMSNNSRGFNHLSLNSWKPISTVLGNFEFQLISAKLESSGFLPSGSDLTYGGNLIYRKKINQLSRTDDWRYMQAYNISYNPKFFNELTIGFIRWVNFYSALIDGYYWMSGKTGYFPVFSNIFRRKDKYVSRETEKDQAAGLYFKFFDKDSKLEIYSEYHYNDSKLNLRDLLVDPKHSRAFSLGIQKGLNTYSKDLILSWEWTQLEQTAGRLIRSAGSWYGHARVMDGYTNRGEVLGASIGPGSNSHNFELKVINSTSLSKLTYGLSIVEHDNDFYYLAFDSSNDFRRYWKDFNFYFNVEKNIGGFYLYLKTIYTRSLNYNWGLIENVDSSRYYQPGIDINNFHISLKFSYFFN